jgi:hypothetical protein
MGREQILQQIGIAAAAGLIGTVAAVQAVRTVNQRVAPQATADPGHIMTNRAGQAVPARVPDGFAEALKTAAGTMLSFGFGSAGAAVYSAWREEPKVLLDGALLGTGIWAISELGGLPAPPAGKRMKGQVARSLARHMLFGIATIAAYRRLRRALA